MNLPSVLPENLIPNEFGMSGFIAGGYAACPELASDIDVWVTVPESDNLSIARERLLAHLTAQGYAFEPEEGAKSVSDPYPFATVKVAIVQVPGSLPVHLLVTGGSMEQVLNDFDISTHQCAITRRGERVYKGDRFTPLTEEPRILKMTPTTPARLEKIRARYAHLRPQETNAETIF